MQKLNPAQLAIIGLSLTITGLFGVVPALFSSTEPALAAPGQTAAAAPVETKPVEQAPQMKTGHPVRVEAPTVGVDMPVVDGFYDNKSNEWTLYDNKAMFGAMTSQPNDYAGQTFIYGHATDRVFGKLLNMKIDQPVYVYTSNGYKFTYKLKETHVVSPSDTGILNYNGGPRLLLQTCVGTFSENRKFFILDYAAVDKI